MLKMTTRRLFLRNTSLILAAPAIVRFDSLMKVSAVEQPLLIRGVMSRLYFSDPHALTPTIGKLMIELSDLPNKHHLLKVLSSQQSRVKVEQ